jgi:hypothetical protein
MVLRVSEKGADSDAAAMPDAGLHGSSSSSGGGMQGATGTLRRPSIGQHMQPSPFRMGRLPSSRAASEQLSGLGFRSLSLEP